jgi:hypothetical protein
MKMTNFGRKPFNEDPYRSLHGYSSEDTMGDFQDK